MAYALYSATTGQILAVYYQLPTNGKPARGIASQRMAFAEVPARIGPTNSYIDLGTGQAAPTGPPVIYLSRYTYDTTTGQLMSSVHGNVEVASIPDTIPAGLIISDTHRDDLPGGWMLSLDDKGRAEEGRIRGAHYSEAAAYRGRDSILC